MLESIPVRAVSVVVVAFIAGATAPTYYAQERLRGFGRSVASRLPYKPPAGMDEDEAMLAASEENDERTS
ncbi:MAG: hypothetical protein ACI8XM_000252 [Haloarculaceae archaeon]|jgi:hypothetical protein